MENNDNYMIMMMMMMMIGFFFCCCVNAILVLEDPKSNITFTVAFASSMSLRITIKITWIFIQLHSFFSFLELTSTLLIYCCDMSMSMNQPNQRSISIFRN